MFRGPEGSRPNPNLEASASRWRVTTKILSTGVRWLVAPLLGIGFFSVGMNAFVLWCARLTKKDERQHVAGI